MPTPEILIIDDEEMVRTTISSALSAAGYSPVPAGSVHEAIEHMTRSSPDLIISDIYMSDGDGFQVLSHARGNSSTASTPFLLMTGRFEPAIMRRGMAMGANDFILKPFSPKQLVASVDARLNCATGHRNQEEGADQRLVQIVNSLPMVVGTCDPNEGMISFLNHSGYSMLNIDPTIPAQALNLRDIICSPDVPVDLHSLLDQLRRGSPWKGEHTLSGGQGTRISAMLRITPHFNSTGKVEYLSFTAQPRINWANELQEG